MWEIAKDSVFKVHLRVQSLATYGVIGYRCVWSHSVAHTLGRTPLDEGSARHRDLYLAFEPVISVVFLWNLYGMMVRD